MSTSTANLNKNSLYLQYFVYTRMYEYIYIYIYRLIDFFCVILHSTFVKIACRELLSIADHLY